MPVKPLCLWSTTNYRCQQVTLITYPTVDARKIFSKVNLSELIFVRSPPANLDKKDSIREERRAVWTKPIFGLSSLNGNLFSTDSRTRSPGFLRFGLFGSLQLGALPSGRPCGLHKQ